MFGLSSSGLVGLRRVVSLFGGEEGLGHGDEGDNRANDIVADAEFFVAKVIRLGFHGLFLLSGSADRVRGGRSPVGSTKLS